MEKDKINEKKKKHVCDINFALTQYFALQRLYNLLSLYFAKYTSHNGIMQSYHVEDTKANSLPKRTVSEKYIQQLVYMILCVCVWK